MRVVSLVPSVTETLERWGVTPIACTRFCERPDLVHVGGTKDPDVEAIVALAPDLVVMDREENRREDATALGARGLDVHVTHVVDLDSLDRTLGGLAVRVGVPPPPPVRRRRRIRRATALTLIWKRPLMALGADTYGASLLADLGVATVVDAALGRYPMVDDVRWSDVDLLLLPSEPYPFAERHLTDAAVLTAAPGARPALVDGQDLLWWGARTDGASQHLDVLMDDLLAAH